ncbi:RNA polymerase sigma factor [Maribellus maritimus]|uniref:RNA polymerase sigma factor n=1 Tax=Maribellus maritimus TaxID=2870838 RepID=UPI001EEB9F61|nr:RNA polymerase sigma factor [Maribellus maritimus]MCG6187282.1 RNA polymerase sigma factor [Maribellus maritimus]
MKDNNVKSVDFLWYLFLNGDDKVFSAIYHQYIERLLSYGYKLCQDRDLVHDSIQEMFLDLFLKRKKTGKKIGNLKAYLFVAFRNGLIKKIKKQNKYKSIELVEDAENKYFDSNYDIQNELIDFDISNELKEKLSVAVNNLSPKQKEIIYLKFEEGLEYTEISAIMKISVESSRKLLYRALLALRKILDPKTVEVFFTLFFKKS